MGRGTECTFIHRPMVFEWDERKRRGNLMRHGLDFMDAEELFRGPMLTALDTRDVHGEDRWRGIGMCRGRVLVVAFTERDRGNVIRIISLRKALSREQRAYEREILAI